MSCHRGRKEQNNSLDSQEDETSNDDARRSPDDVGGSPAVPEHIQVCQINTEDVGQTVAEVNPPGKYPVGHTATVRSEVGNQMEFHQLQVRGGLNN